MSDPAASDNPFRSPQEPIRPPRPVVALPGWIVLIFGVTGLMLPLAGIEDYGRQLRLQQIMFAVMYGLPCMVAAWVFGATNLRLGRDRRSSIAGMVVAGIAAITVIILVMRQL